MEKYLKRTPRVKPDRDVVACSSSSGLKQSTLHSLKGVVVVEEIEYLKCKLQLPGQSVDILLTSLKELSKKVPPRHILLSTKIGHTVNKLRKHPDQAVSSEAKRVYVKWMSYFKEKREKPQIEVKYDKKTEDVRLTAKRLFSEVLGTEQSNFTVEAVEREVFHCHKRRACPACRRTMRAIVFKLRNSEETKSSLLNGALSIEEFVKQNKKI
ncbi:transcription elongation factor a n-terminal and central domain-containing protein 2 [Plakobranchus ocellatus]|uniref:Transcription elongation factor a n-terminal and central domain-containing protein 2 n=1 Tax=Plakobranchus ocellatus TaxID=259542 RepID=A0AAV3ZKJ0_9GAST|nr:transcription elongation factor a n-terminal and central domain-containing protein 2 [Plakobranchus ocellatus]